MLIILYWLSHLFVTMQCANILGYFPTVSFSHHMTFRPIYKALSLRGHNVTVITTFPLRDPHLTNLTEIDMGSELKSKVDVVKGLSSSNTEYGRLKFMFKICRLELMKHLENEEVFRLLRNNIKFDVVLVQPLCPLVYAVAGHVKAPTVGYFPSYSVSHQMTFRPVVRELSLRGHNVTVITALPLRDSTLTNLTEIDVKFELNMNIIRGLSSSSYDRVNFVSEWCTSALKLQLEKISQLPLSETKFDVVLVQPMCPIAFSVVGQHSAPIIGYFPIPSVSHQRVFLNIWQELSLRGHQVTVITPNPLNDPSLINLTEIEIGYSYDALRYSSNFVVQTMAPNAPVSPKLFFINEFTEEMSRQHFEDKRIEKLINGDTKYDLVIFNPLSKLALGFPAKFRVPSIAISSFGVLLSTHDSLGNPTHPLLYKDIFNTFDGPPTFTTKLTSFLYHFWFRALYYWYFLPQADKVAREYLGDDIPYLGDVENNVSLVLVNENYLMNTVRPNVPNIVEIGQVHIREKQPLPKDLQEYLDNSPQGVVYLSFGSNVKSANLTESLRNTIIGALSELPYNVLWKWETDSLPGQPKNVLIRKWLPQQDVLGHPNIKAFITQGGYQSIEEAIHNEAPMVGMPFMSDQPGNVQKLVDLGMAIKLDYNTVTKKQLKEAILEVARNKKYKESVAKAKSILEDQPIKGLEKAIWWIEYVIRHKGAPHLRSPAADMSFFEYFMIDVVVFLLTVAISASVIVYFLLKFTLRMLIDTKHTKVKVN